MDRLKAFYSDEGPASPKDGGKSSPKAHDGSPRRGLRREFGEFEALFVLLVAEDCLRMYTAAAIHAGDRTTLKKEKVRIGRQQGAPLSYIQILNSWVFCFP